MPQNFIESRREQAFLLPPDVRDWLAPDHLAWFVIDAAGEMELAPFYGAYRCDGHGRAAYEPGMMVRLLLYAYATGQRSSRAIERHCRQDVAYRVITGNLVPDHATIARFVVRHEVALGELFGEVLRLCDEAGLVAAGVIAIDGTRLAGNANRNRSRDYAEIAQEIIAEVKASDAAEDERLGAARGDELPEQLRTPEGRRAFLRAARARCTREASGEADGLDGEMSSGHDDAADEAPVSSGSAEAPVSNGGDEPPASGGGDEVPVSSGCEFVFDSERIVARVQGREGWLREAQRQLEQHRWQDPEAVPRSREERLVRAAERLEEQLEAERAGNDAYEQYRAAGRMKNGRRFGKPPKPYQPPEIPAGQVNITDPDSKLLKSTEGYVQGYNAQAVVDEGQIVLAAEITNSTVDWSQLAPMVRAMLAELERAGVNARPEVALADAQYWNEEHIDHVVAEHHIQVLIPPDSGTSTKPRAGWTGGRYSWMRAVLGSEAGKQHYRKRKYMIEPVFGHTRHNRQITHFLRRGRRAVRTEWRLLMATHNLTKLHRHTIAATEA